jgi:hypothetical protein
MMEATALLPLHAFTVCTAKPLPCFTFTSWRLPAAYPTNLLLEKEPHTHWVGRRMDRPHSWSECGGKKKNLCLYQKINPVFPFYSFMYPCSCCHVLRFSLYHDTNVRQGNPTLKWTVFVYTNACKKTPLEIHFIHLHNKEICCIFKTCCIINVVFSTKCHSFNNFYHFLFKYTFFTNHALKFKYQPVIESSTNMIFPFS